MACIQGVGLVMGSALQSTEYVSFMNSLRFCFAYVTEPRPSHQFGQHLVASGQWYRDRFACCNWHHCFPCHRYEHAGLVTISLLRLFVVHMQYGITIVWLFRCYS